MEKKVRICCRIVVGVRVRSSVGPVDVNVLYYAYNKLSRCEFLFGLQGRRLNSTGFLFGETVYSLLQSSSNSVFQPVAKRNYLRRTE